MHVFGGMQIRTGEHNTQFKRNKRSALHTNIYNNALLTNNAALTLDCLLGCAQHPTHASVIENKPTTTTHTHQETTRINVKCIGAENFAFYAFDSCA